MSALASKLSNNDFRLLTDGWKTLINDSTMTDYSSLWKRYISSLDPQNAVLFSYEDYTSIHLLWKAFANESDENPVAWQKFVSLDNAELESGWIYVGQSNPFDTAD